MSDTSTSNGSAGDGSAGDGSVAHTGAGAADGQPPVTVYSRQLCGYSTAAMRLLERKGVAFTEHDATFDPDLRQEMMRRSGRSTFPQIFVGDTHVGGCDDLMALERAGKLDVLLGR